MATFKRPVLILGAGINGAAIARELALNGVPVTLVDAGDVAGGTTAYSSRLIHGGLRYLEYGEFSLVRESLAERGRLLQLAPQFVQPLQLQIPIRRLGGGWASAALKFLRRASTKTQERGLLLVRTGLWLYDRYARDPHLPRHSVYRVGSPEAVPVNSAEYRWLCSYWDAQILYPERFVLSLLHDAVAASEAAGVDFRVLPYHQAKWNGGRVAIFRRDRTGGAPEHRFLPAAVVNATGAWVDRTLNRMNIAHRQLIGGTKGSHLLTFHPPLCEALDGVGLYGEASDGRPTFILPWRDGVLVGTTDIAWDGDPATAVATEEELDYLLNFVNHMLPQVDLRREHVHLHYAGVRPLPHVAAGSTGAITRRHWIERHSQDGVPVFSVIGGKLTTCRSLAEDAAAKILKQLGQPVVANSRQRPLPGKPEAAEECAKQADSPELTVARQLLGSTSEALLSKADGPLLTDTDVPLALARWSIQHEWVTSLEDVVERRMMLLFEPRLSRRSLEKLADLMVETGKREPQQAGAEVEAVINRMQNRYGKHLKNC